MNTKSLRILAALTLGLLLGSLLATFDAPVLPAALAIAKPIGSVWLDALTMTVVPLVFSLMVTGIANTAQQADGGGIAAHSLSWFAVLLLGSTVLAAGATWLALDLWPAPISLLALPVAGPLPAIAPAGEWFVGIVPANPIKAAAETAIAPLVVFAVLFGFAVTKIEASLRVLLQSFFQAAVEAMLVVVGWVLLVAPAGVFALALIVGAQAGAKAAGALLHYVLVISAACLLTTLFAYGVAVVLGRITPLGFARAALPAQTVAISTQSSLASLPAMIAASGDLGVTREPASIVLPLAVSIFRAASAAANIAVAIYLARLHSVDIGWTTAALGALAAAVISVAAVGLPAQVSFFTTIAPVCLAMGVPVVLLPLLLAVESIPDIFRTLGNVTSDLAVVRIVGAKKPRQDAEVTPPAG